MFMKIVVQEPGTFIKDLSHCRIARLPRTPRFKLVVCNEARPEMSQELRKLTPRLLIHHIVRPLLD
jgi:hypothetical protein